MKIDGLTFIFEALAKTPAGRCCACDHELPPMPPRTREFTCDEVCHRLWVEQLIRQYGDTKIITLTGKRYRVPTRDILEYGVDAQRLLTYPEVL